MGDILGASRLGFLDRIDTASTWAPHMCDSPLRSFTVLLIIPVAQANSSMLLGQVIEETGIRPRHVSFKPTAGLNLQMGSVDRCLEMLMLGCTDLFTYSSSVGGEVELGFFIPGPDTLLIYTRYYWLGFGGTCL